jgi:hypothetical protein
MTGTANWSSHIAAPYAYNEKLAHLQYRAMENGQRRKMASNLGNQHGGHCLTSR